MSGIDDLLPYLDAAQGPWELGICGPYSLVKLIGYGGMGAVFLGVGDTAERVAVKIALPDKLTDNDKAHDRFVREIEHQGSINSSYVVPLVNKGNTNGINGRSLPWLAMEFIKGRNLADKIAKWGRLPQVEVHC